MGEFPGLQEGIDAFLRGKYGVDDKEECKRLLCADCQFFTPGEDEELECGCYRILERLMRQGLVTWEQLADAIKD